MRVLVGCEHSGVVRDAFIKRGHDAVSCDFLESQAGGPHIIGDVLEVAKMGFDLAILHPPCTYLSSSGLHWNKRVEGRDSLTEEALEFVRKLMALDIERIAIENPVGRISTAIRKPDQIIQPFMFGHDASKSTCLWLKNLPPLAPTLMAQPRMVGDRPRWGNQTDSGQNRLPPSKDRWAKRSRTYEGIAEAMASQWGQVVE